MLILIVICRLLPSFIKIENVYVDIKMFGLEGQQLFSVWVFKIIIVLELGEDYSSNS